MQPNQHRTSLVEGMAWTGRILSLPLALFLLVDGGMQWSKPAVAEDAVAQFCNAEQVPTPFVIPSGTVVSIPQAAQLDAIRFTTDLREAVATHFHVFRVGNGLVAVIVGVVLLATFLISMIESYEL